MKKVAISHASMVTAKGLILIEFHPKYCNVALEKQLQL